MLQGLLKDRGGTVETYFLDGRPASCTATVYDGNGSKKVDAAACTIDSVQTTLASTAEEGDTDLALVSAAGVVQGRRYLIGGSAPEVVTVRSVTNNAVELWAPLAFDHASNLAYEGLRVSYVVGTSPCASLWWDGYVDFIPVSGDVNTETVDCVRRMIPYALIGLPDIRQIIPAAMNALSSSLDLAVAFREARDQLLIRLGGKNRAHTILGVDHFRRPCSLMFWSLRRHEFGAEWTPQMDAVDAELKILIADIISQAPVDADQDGATNGPQDRGFTSIRLDRA